MPLSALDLLEMRGLPRDSSLLPASETGLASREASPPHSASGPVSGASGEGAVTFGQSAGGQEGAVGDSTGALAFAAHVGRPPGAQSPCDTGDAKGLSLRRHARSHHELGTVGPRLKSRTPNTRHIGHSASFTFRNRCGSPDARPRCARAGVNAASFPGATTRRMKSWSSRQAKTCGW